MKVTSEVQILQNSHFFTIINLYLFLNSAYLVALALTYLLLLKTGTCFQLYVFRIEIFGLMGKDISEEFL